jgi:CDP-diacylglycerol--glycerol-3-phosphate 3-phosphatidyltransferase
VIIGAGVILLATFWLGRARSAGEATGFVAASLAAWLIVVGNLRRAMARAPTPLGLATQVTLARGLLVSLVAGFVLVRPVGVVAWAPAALYTAASLADRLDGALARRRGEVTAVGAELDGATDALGLLVAPLVAVAWGRLPPWYLLVGAAYYLFRAGIWLRRRRGLPVHPERVVPNAPTRFFAGAQMILVCAALPPVLSPHATAAAATILMIPPLLFFARDWRRVTGRAPAP